MLLDEADTFVKNNEDLRGIIDAGHKYDGSVIRCAETRDGIEPRQFTVFAPVAIAAIGHLPGTIEDRSIIIRLRRRLAEETVDTLRVGATEHLEVLSRQAARWVIDNAVALSTSDPAMPKDIVNRQADNWRPLLAVADAAGGYWPEYAREIAAQMCRTSGGISIKEMLLNDLRKLFDTPLLEPDHKLIDEIFAEPPDVLFTKEILEGLKARDDRPWSEWKEGNPITGPQLAKLLKPLGIPTNTTVRRGGRDGPAAKGYRRKDFTDVFDRYAPKPATQEELHGETA
jgi:hypothetical protein